MKTYYDLESGMERKYITVSSSYKQIYSLSHSFLNILNYVLLYCKYYYCLLSASHLHLTTAIHMSIYLNMCIGVCTCPPKREQAYKDKYILNCITSTQKVLRTNKISTYNTNYPEGYPSCLYKSLLLQLTFPLTKLFNLSLEYKKLVTY